MTPGSARAIGRAEGEGSRRKVLISPLTITERLAVSIPCMTQPSAPSRSRMRRQVSNSAVTSTGIPRREKTH